MTGMSAGARTYGGATSAERRTRRHAALLDAALDLVAQSGVGGLTVRGVCGCARLNDRYFYESFRSTEDLLLALFDREVGLASAALIVDFDAIKRGVEGGAPRKFAWSGAFGLTVTLVWLYVEFLRLIAMFTSNR